jgi:ubiquinone biosynthesis accessory factor UbiJ
MTAASRIQPLPTVLTAFLESALNGWLGASSEHPAIRRLAGHSIAVEVQPPGVGLVFLGAADRIQVLGALEGEVAEVTLCGSPVALAAAFGQGDRSGIRVQGDAGVLTDLQRALAEVSFDWLQWLEALTGAGTAGPLLQAGASLRTNLERLVARSLEDTVDYAQEEAGWLPPAGEFEAWSEDLATLRDDLARLEARVQRLAVRPRPGSPAAPPPAPE